jgi:hypothetical protein
MWAELIHVDRQTWRIYNIIVAIRNYANAPKSNVALIDACKARLKLFVTFDAGSL